MKLFVSSGCAPCKVVKEYIDKHNIKVEIISVETEHGMKQLKDLKVKAVPVLVDGGDVYIGVSPALEQLRQITLIQGI